MSIYYYTALQILDRFNASKRSKFKDTNNPYILIQLEPLRLNQSIEIVSHHITLTKKPIIIDGRSTEYHHTLNIKHDSQPCKLHIYYDRSDQMLQPRTKLESGTALSSEELDSLLRQSIKSIQPPLSMIFENNRKFKEKYLKKVNDNLALLNHKDALNNTQNLKDCINILNNLISSLKNLQPFSEISYKGKINFYQQIINAYQYLSLANPSTTNTDSEEKVASSSAEAVSIEKSSDIAVKKKKKKKRKKKKSTAKSVFTLSTHVDLNLSAEEKNQANRYMTKTMNKLETYLRDLNALEASDRLETLLTSHQLLNLIPPKNLFGCSEKKLQAKYKHYQYTILLKIQKFFNQLDFNDRARDLRVLEAIGEKNIKVEIQDTSKLIKLIQRGDKEILEKTLIITNTIEDNAYNGHILTDWCVKFNQMDCFELLIQNGFIPYPTDWSESLLINLRDTNYNNYQCYLATIYRNLPFRDLSNFMKIHENLHQQKLQDEGSSQLPLNIAVTDYINSLKDFEKAVLNKFKRRYIHKIIRQVKTSSEIRRINLHADVLRFLETDPMYFTRLKENTDITTQIISSSVTIDPSDIKNILEQQFNLDVKTDLFNRHYSKISSSNQEEQVPRALAISLSFTHAKNTAIKELMYKYILSGNITRVQIEDGKLSPVFNSRSAQSHYNNYIDIIRAKFHQVMTENNQEVLSLRK